MAISNELLKHRALESAKSWGHVMGEFEPVAPYKTMRRRAMSDCEYPRCQAYVFIDAKPKPNVSNILGTAVSRNCPVIPELS